MARALRIQYPGAWYHLTARGNERRAIFRDDRDRRHFLELAEEAVDRYRLRWCAYVLMDNHWHGLVQIREPNLSAACQWLGQSYAIWFNVRHGRTGHLFQGRFKGILIDGEVSGGEVSRYLHLNPVRIKRYGLDKRAQQLSRAGVLERSPDREQLAARLKRLREYRWSSYPAYVGWEKSPGWLDVGTVLGMMGGGKEEDRRRGYRKYVEEAVREGLAESPWERVVGGVVLGGPKFVRQVRRWLGGDRREQPGLKGLEGRVSFEQVVKVVEQIKGERWLEFRDRHGDWGRDLVLYLARRHSGLTLGVMAEKSGGTDYGGASMAIKRFWERAKVEKRLRRIIDEAEVKLRRILKVETTGVKC